MNELNFYDDDDELSTKIYIYSDNNYELCIKILLKLEHELHGYIGWLYFGLFVNYHNCLYWLHKTDDSCVINYICGAIQKRIKYLYQQQMAKELHIALTVIYSLYEKLKNYSESGIDYLEKLISSFKNVKGQNLRQICCNAIINQNLI